MKPSSSSAFTFAEVITAIVVAVILAALVIQLSPYLFKKPPSGRAAAEMAMLSAACESYKTDFGAYPEDFSEEQSTNKLRPKNDFKPTKKEYELANRFLYKELTGDKLGAGGGPDGIPEKRERTYLREFDPKLLKTTKDTTNKVLEVRYIQDPFGNPYGYSTAAARRERRYLEDLKIDADTPAPSDSGGFNSSSFDLWSTGGSNPVSEPTEPRMKEHQWAKWVKNW